MNDPRALLSHLLTHGRVIERQLSEAVTPRGRTAAKKLGRKAARDYGVHPALQVLGGLIFDSELDQSQAAREARVESFAFEVRQGLERVSVVKPGLKLTGNSAGLVHNLANANSGARASTRVRAINRLLTKLLQEKLVYNADIPAFLKQKQMEAWKEERERKELRYVDLSDLPPGFISIKHPNREAALAGLKGFPTIREVMEGAIHAASGDAPDGRQQALGSCRRALEAMARELSGQGDWKVAMKGIRDEEVNAMIRKLYSFLSSKGAHGAHRVSEANVQLGLRQTFGALDWMIAHRIELWGG